MMGVEISAINPSPAPAVSVLMPVYNNAPYLAQAVECVLAQTFGDFELIAINDGSSDDSLAILDRFASRDTRVRVISRANTGICGALNDGLAAARGRLIARMDGDDMCEAQRLAVQVGYLDAHPHCIAVGCALQCTDLTGSPTSLQNPPTEHAQIDQGLIHGRADVLVHATLVARTRAMRAIGGYRSQYEWVEDLDLLLRLAEAGPLANVTDCLYRYRRHPASICATRYQQMCQRVSQVLAEAYQRRGLGQPPELLTLRPELARQDSASDFYRNWACHAVHRGNGKLARQHALAALRRDPFSINSWKVMYWALSA